MIEKAEKATRNWLEQVVIDLNFCPFAKKPFLDNSIRILVDQNKSDHRRLNTLETELKLLEQDASIATTLIVYQNEFIDFEHYLDWAAFGEDQLKVWGYEGAYQLATFHPNYLFDGTSENDPSNYTNRSPFPMLHLIREDDVEWARERHPNVESIPDTNIKKTTNLGIEKMKQILRGCLTE